MQNKIGNIKNYIKIKTTRIKIKLTKMIKNNCKIKIAKQKSYKVCEIKNAKIFFLQNLLMRHTETVDFI